LKEATGDLVADLDARDTGTDLHHLAGTIGQGDDVVLYRHAVGIAHNAKIAKVERARSDLDQHLAVGRLGLGALHLDQRIDADAALQ
jgi:hypothetical protein